MGRRSRLLILCSGSMKVGTVVHFRKPRISYLFYPNFDTDPHPALHTSMEIDLRNLYVYYRDYDPNDNPPLLHQKDSMVTAAYPLYGKFVKLTRQEEGWGLLDDLRPIYGTRGWQKRLEEHCAELKGHRVVWRKDADLYRVKLVRSAIRGKQANWRKDLMEAAKWEAIPSTL